MSDCLSLRERYLAPGDGNPRDPVWTQHLRDCPHCRLAYQGLPQVDQALAELAQLPVSVPSFDAIAGVAAGVARGQRRRRAVRRSVPYLYTGLGTAALAAGLVAAVLVGRARQHAPKLLVAGAELRATSEAKAAVLGNGARVRLESGTLKLATASKQSQSLVLSLGRVFVEVPKLAPGETLSVRTPDAEVRVRGTRFQVVRTSLDTQVSVVEGVVEVRPEGIGRPLQTLRAGESATVGSAEAYREGLRHSTLEALDHGEFAAAEKQIGQLLGAGAESSQQAEAQALLAWSLSARGKRGEAIARYRQALLLLPEAEQPLWAENACAELAILMANESPQQSAQAWAECLRRFPHGVHAALARSRVHSTR
jgi:ferric-dicitrate binding protein FerR (iron transport regulator)